MLALTFGLAGCAGGFAGFGGGGVDQLPLLGGEVTVAGPDGFCVDPRSSRPGSGFAIIGACANLSDDGALPPVLGVLTVQVAGPGTASVDGNEAALADLLRSGTGQALLGPVAQIDLRLVETFPDAVLAYYVDAGDPPIPGASQTTWRAFTDINGRLVTLSLRGLTAAPISRDQGEALMQSAIDRLFQVNDVDRQIDT